jgi:hypothetical protein
MINDPSEWRWTMPETHAPEMCELDIAELEVVSGGDGVNGGQNRIRLSASARPPASRSS